MNAVPRIAPRRMVGSLLAIGALAVAAPGLAGAAVMGPEVKITAR
jgi:hypothetical protein